MREITRVTPGQVDYNIAFAGVVVGEDGLGMDWLTNEEIEEHGNVERAIVVSTIEDYAKMEKGDFSGQFVGLLYTDKGKYLVAKSLGEPVVSLFSVPHHPDL